MSLSRFVQIDALRGLLLIMMTADHLLLWPFNFWPKIYKHLYGPLGFFSAAEAFFLISGLLAGLLLATKPQAILRNLKGRLWKLYIGNLLCLSMFTISIFLMPSFFVQWGQSSWYRPLLQHPLELTLLAGFFLYLPPFFNILPVYFVFFLFLPLIYFMIRTKKVLWLLLGSSLIWFLGQFSLLKQIEIVIKKFIPMVSLGWFDIFSWQILFVIAVIVGYYFALGKLTNFIKNPHKSLIFMNLTFCIMCFFVRHELYLTDINWQKWSDVQTLGFLRLVNFLSATYLITLLLNKTKLLQLPILALLGSNSLKVFLYHSCLVYFLAAFKNEIDGLSNPIKITVFCLSLLSLYLPVFKFIVQRYETSLS